MKFIPIHISHNYQNKTVVAVILLLLLLLQPFKSLPQDTTVTPTTRQEVWPEVDVYYRFNDKFRLYTSLSATRLKNSTYTDGGFSVNLDYFALPMWRKAEASADSARGHLLWFRTGFSSSYTPQDDDSPIKDYTLVEEMTGRFYLPWKLLLTARNRFDLRWRNEDFQPRYRPRLKLERGFKTEYLTFTVYTYGEYYVNFDSDVTNRFRFALGWEVKVAKRMSFETYFVHQFENNLSVLSVNAIGLAMKLFFQKGDLLFGKKK